MPYNNFRPFDMSKDFDTVQHNVLGNKINAKPHPVLFE